MKGRTVTAGKTRTCPHCKATILESAPVCPACRHHLRFGVAGVGADALPGEVAFRVEGSIAHPAGQPPREYSVVVALRNARGEEIARRVVGVGAMEPGEVLSLDVTLETFRTRE
ncbi:MAG: hypothetical protein MUC71_05820 [Steroidobacteraceae bacterium]|jgi:hypothetical protein|nr:hypothetical protein [Steroidobacteraceae bacterium]